MSAIARNLPTSYLRRTLPTRALLVGIAGALVLLTVPTVAEATSDPGATTQVRHAVAVTPKAKSSICDKVSAASVSAIIGYKVPAGSVSSFAVKPTKANYGISGTNTICTYGSETTMASLLKVVSLSYEVISKPLTSAEMQQSLEKASAGVKFKFSSYSGLGVTAFYFSLTEAGITGQGITGVQDGTHYFGASVESKNVSKSTIAALAKLAENL